MPPAPEADLAWLCQHLPKPECPPRITGRARLHSIHDPRLWPEWTPAAGGRKPSGCWFPQGQELVRQLRLPFQPPGTGQEAICPQGSLSGLRAEGQTLGRPPPPPPPPNARPAGGEGLPGGAAEGDPGSRRCSRGHMNKSSHPWGWHFLPPPYCDTVRPLHGPPPPQPGCQRPAAMGSSGGTQDTSPSASPARLGLEPAPSCLPPTRLRRATRAGMDAAPFWRGPSWAAFSLPS